MSLTSLAFPPHLDRPHAHGLPDLGIAEGPVAAPEVTDRLLSACRAFTTRRIPEERLAGLHLHATPAPGDLLLARVESLGQHAKLHLPNGRRRQLFAGDEIVVVCGDRYASDQYEAQVPPNLGPCHLVAGAGMAGVMQRKHRDMRPPTALQPLGLVTTEDGAVLNVASAALATLPCLGAKAVPTVAVVGTSMNAGKTTTAAFLTRGLTRAGRRVAYIKATGTSASGDPGLLEDAGAILTLDCLDAGFVSTYRVSPHRIERAFLNLLAHACRQEPDLVVIEIADGLLQSETDAFLSSETARAYLHGVLFAAGDAMGAAMGCDWLSRRGHRILGITGTLTSAPLQAEEAAAATGLPVHRTSDLAAPALANALVHPLLVACLRS